MSDELKTALGVDFGGTSVKAAVVRGDQILGEIERIPTQDFTDQHELIDVIVDKINGMKKQYPEIAAVGVGVPGAVDFGEGMTYNLTNVPGWKSVRLRDILSERTGIPTMVENDANCMAFAEWKYGAGRGFENLVCVTLGTGVGGGLILNGQMYRGNQYAAGEIGQMSVDLHGVDGPYGNSGALERYIGNRQISELAKQMYFDHDGTKLEDADSTPEALSTRAHQGDEIARRVWKRVADYLGNVLSSIIYLLNPDAIVIGGGVAYAGDLLFKPLREILSASLSEEFFKKLNLVPAKFGNTAGIIGCSAMALHEVGTTQQG